MPSHCVFLPPSVGSSMLHPGERACSLTHGDTPVLVSHFLLYPQLPSHGTVFLLNPALEFLLSHLSSRIINTYHCTVLFQRPLVSSPRPTPKPTSLLEDGSLFLLPLLLPTGLLYTVAQRTFLKYEVGSHLFFLCNPPNTLNILFE